ncbi:MAG: hypothetical protein ACMZ66_05590 [Thalassospira sp.]|uniref:hypothetical protein n=1 Tax=Thalassospira sp. TaxID=1912094 RepID=UPI003A8769F8
MTQRKAVVDVFELSELDTGQRAAKRAGWTHIAQGMLLKEGSNAGKLTKEDVEIAARAIAEERTVTFTDDWWKQELAHYYNMSAEFPDYENSQSLIPDAMREAKAVIRSLGLEVEG